MKMNGIARYQTDLWMDSKGKDVQNQISDAKNRLKELTSDTVLNEEEKERKRQQIRQELANLNKELKKRQWELQREQNDPSSSDPKGTNAAEASLKTDNKPQTGTKATIAADSAISHAASHNKLASELESRVRILQGEIKQDEALGKDTSLKQKELEKLENKAARLNGTGFYFLADASKELKQAMEKEIRPDKKSKTGESDGFVRPLKPPFSPAPKSKTDIYIKKNMFSHVDFHF